MRRASIVVVGSSNTDLTVVAERLPQPGETVIGGDLLTTGGGKGANQAVAAARAGADVAFVGRVGDDPFGHATLENLKREGIKTEALRIDEHAPSGVALIIVDKRGENLIAVAPGANARLSPSDIDAATPLIAAADLVLLQLEIPLATVRAAVFAAAECGVPVLLNPAPATDLPEEILSKVSYLTPNRGEAARLLGAEVPESPQEMARQLLKRGVRAVVLTAGAQGAYACEGGECVHIPAPKVKAVDTVGAGDCFSGALAVALAEGMPLCTAAQFAACAAALSVQRSGAQPSMPTRAEIEQLFKRRRTF